MVKIPDKPHVKPTKPEDKPLETPRKNWYWGFGIFFVLLGLIMSTNDFIEWEDGKPVLAPWRQEKLEREIAKYDEAEQYVLLADKDGWYPCYNCPGSSLIYLHAGEVWKYGVTINEERGRYKSGLPFKNLIYLTEYVGPISECLKREKTQIYTYAVLPENMQRPIPLIRPPGNKRDN